MTKLNRVGRAPGSDALPGFAPQGDEDDVARLLLRPLFHRDRETLVLAGFDAFERLIGFEPVDEGTIGRCTIAPRRWRRLLTHGTAHVVMAHNHPSGDARPSEADLICPRDAAAFLAILGIDLADHLIFVEAGHYSFRRAGLL